MSNIANIRAMTLIINFMPFPSRRPALPCVPTSALCRSLPPHTQHTQAFRECVSPNEPRPSGGVFVIIIYGPRCAGKKQTLIYSTVPYRIFHPARQWGVDFRRTITQSTVYHATGSLEGKSLNPKSQNSAAVK